MAGNFKKNYKYPFILLFIFLSGIGFSQQPKLMLPIGHTGAISTAVFSNDGKKVITISGLDNAKIWDVASGKLLADLVGHTGNFESALFSPDDKKIVTASDDSTAIIWNAETGKPIVTLYGHAYEVQSAIFSPDGKKIRTFSYYDSKVKIWDAASGKLINEMDEFIKEGRNFSFSPDWKKIVIPSEDNSATIFDIATSKIIAVIKAPTKSIRSTSFSGDGKKILTTYHNDSIYKLWNAETGEHISDFNGEGYKNISGHLSPDGKRYAILSNDGTTRIINTETGKLHINLKLKDKINYPQVFSPDGKKIVTSSNDFSSQLWEVSSGLLLATLKGHTALVGWSSFSTDGKKIVTGSVDQSARIWETATGKLIAVLEGHSYKVKLASFSPNGAQILTGTDDSSKIWDSKNGNPLIDLVGTALTYSIDGTHIITGLPDYSSNVYDARSGKLLNNLKDFPLRIHSNLSPFSPDGKKIACQLSDSNIIRIYGFPSGNPIIDLIGNTDAIYSVYFSPDGKKIATVSEKSVKIWDAATGKLNVDLIDQPVDFWNSKPADFSSSVCFSLDGQRILTSSGKTAKIWNATNGKLLVDFKGHTSTVNSATFSPDETRIVTASYDNTAKIWNADNGNLIVDLPGHKHGVTFASFFDAGKKVLTYSEYDYTAKIWDAVTGKLIFDLKGHTDNINSATISADEKRVITASDDNTSKIWDLTTGKLIYTLINLGSSDYINILANGYYKANANATKLLHYVTRDLRVITFEQLDVKYNRPDKVLEAIGNTDTALIKSYRKAYEKRIKKLGIDTTAFRDGYSVPEADFTNRAAVEYEQKDGTLKLTINGMDSTYQLDRFNVWVNETPVFGERGISIRKRNRNNFDTTIIIKLSQGENKIETSISNVNGTESYRMPLTVNYTAAIKLKERVYFVGIGIDHFAESKYNLQYSAKDIRNLSQKLKEKYKGDIIIDTLFNENVTNSNVKALKQKLLTSSENDKVIVAYSGHGLLSKEYDYYLSTYSVNFEQPDQNGLPYDELENLLDSIPARKKLMMIDACHSGEVDKDDEFTLDATSDSLKKGVMPLVVKKEGKLGLKNSFELMQSLFVNVGKSTGATIISAAAGTGFALERNDLMNGVFTYAVIEAMNKYPTMKLSELKRVVGQRVDEITKGQQKPTSRNETIAVDWEVW